MEVDAFNMLIPYLCCVVAVTASSYPPIIADSLVQSQMAITTVEECLKTADRRSNERRSAVKKKEKKVSGYILPNRVVHWLGNHCLAFDGTAAAQIVGDGEQECQCSQASYDPGQHARIKQIA